MGTPTPLFAPSSSPLLQAAAEGTSPQTAASGPSPTPPPLPQAPRRRPAPPRPVDRVPSPLHRAIAVGQATPSWSAVSGELAPLRRPKMFSPPSHLSVDPVPNLLAPPLAASGHVATGQPPGSAPPLFRVRAAKPSGFWAGQMQPVRNCVISSFPGDFQGKSIHVQTPNSIEIRVNCEF
jgi:hypothetical protein